MLDGGGKAWDNTVTCSMRQEYPGEEKECAAVTKLLMRLFLPKNGVPSDPEVRRRCGTLSGAVGIGMNVVLFLGKLAAALLTGSVAMAADGLNNLSDAATSVVTLVGFRMAGRAADADHPFGHGRIEYITGLIVAVAILFMGVEVGRSAVGQILAPEAVVFSWLAAGVLTASIAVKLWLFFFNRTLGRYLDSAAMEATAADSLSDTVSTGVVLVSLLVGEFLGLYIDGLAGLLVAAFILKTGWEAARDTLDPLLGRPMDRALAEDIDRLVLGHDKIQGIHDLVYHDYGPGRAMMSLHAEVPADGDMLELHDIIDHIERELDQKHHIKTVIHMDPVVNDERTCALRCQVSALVRELDPALSIHDFRITPGPMHTNVLFDLVVPYGFHMSDEQVEREISALVRGLSGKYYPVVQVERSYVN